MANDEMCSVHAGRTNGTLDPLFALRRNNCYGMKKSCLGETTGNREQTGSPQEAREEEVHLFFLSRLVISLCLSLLVKSTRSLLAERECDFHSSSHRQHHKAEYKRVGFKLRDSSITCPELKTSLDRSY